MKQSIAVIALAALMYPIVASAQTSNLNDLSALKKNTRLSIYDELATERKVLFKGVTPEGIEVWTMGKQSELIPATKIRRVEEHRKDGLGKGLGIGFAVGGGLMLLGAAGCVEQFGYGWSECLGAGALIYLLPGVAIGGLVDAAIRERVTVYTAAPATTGARFQGSPLFTLGGAGARLAWRF